MSPKKRKSIQIRKKLEILAEIDKKGKNYTQIGELFGLSKTTISSIAQNRTKIEQASCSSKRMKVKAGKYQNVEEAILKWLKFIRSKNVPVSGLLLQEKATQFAKSLNVPEFNATNGWMDRFKKRDELYFKNIVGEKADAPVEICEDWITNRLPIILKDYEAKNIFNLDETGLFYKMIPNKTLAFKNDTCAGGKHSKERVTILVGANADGSEKLPLLMIGKSAKPRCFKNTKTLPLKYSSNSKSWMTSKIWEDYLLAVDRKFIKEKRNVLFIIDNCPSHTKASDLQAIKLVFMPPNITAICQPMDQGVIKNLKLFYREYILRKIINDLEYAPESSCKDVKITLLDAVNFISKSWEKVKDVTISNCFKKAGIIFTGFPITDEQTTDNVINSLWCNIIVQQSLLTEQVSIQDFLNIDHRIETDAPLTEASIVYEISNASNIQVVESNDDKDEMTDQMLKLN